MKSQTFRSNLGFVLIEAMVALVVVAVGVLGIAKLSALLVRGTGETKTQAEALQIAQDRVERARDFNMATGCASLTNATESNVVGVNSTYGVRTQFAAIGTSNARTVEVCVSWDSGSCDDVDKRIILRSSVMCDGMGTSAQVGAAGASSALGGFIKTPTGRGKVGGGTTVSGGSENFIPGTSIKDGTRSVSSGGVRYITDSSGNVLLSMEKLTCENEPPEFSTITGTVFVEAKNGSPIASAENLKVLSSDASYCAVAPFDLVNRVMPAGKSGNDIKYFYTYYQCYVGAEWWGNVGLVRLDNANANNRVCQGSPANSKISTIFSKHPQINSSRGYRGYRDKGNGVYESKGIGEQETSTSQCPSRKAYVPQFLRNHHFVHASITGSATDSSCDPLESTLKTYAPSGMLDAGVGAPTVEDVDGGKAIVANTNPGKFYCMSSQDGVTCPDLISNVTPPSTLLQGTITADASVNVDNISPTELVDACTSFTFGPRVGNTYAYSCQINWAGFIGSSWNGDISFVFPAAGSPGAGGTLCYANSTISATPSGSVPAYTILDKDATPPNSIRFTDIPTNITNITLNIQAKTTCAVALGQVSVNAWAGTFSQNSPQALTWSTVSGANSYQVESCSGADNAADCASFALAQAVSVTSYTHATVSNNTKLCLRVRAANAMSQYGPYSAVKCVTRSGGNLIYK